MPTTLTDTEELSNRRPALAWEDVPLPPGFDRHTLEPVYRAMVKEHWEAGARDMRNTIAHPEWLQRATENGITTFDLAEPGQDAGVGESVDGVDARATARAEDRLVASAAGIVAMKATTVGLRASSKPEKRASDLYDLGRLLVAGGIVGLVVGFASQSVVSNLVSGLFLMFEHPIKIGDSINVAGISGSVEDADQPRRAAAWRRRCQRDRRSQKGRCSQRDRRGQNGRRTHGARAATASSTWR